MVYGLGRLNLKKTNEENKRAASRAVSAYQFDPVSTIQYSIARNFVVTCILLAWMDVPLYYVLGSIPMIFQDFGYFNPMPCQPNLNGAEPSGIIANDTG